MMAHARAGVDASNRQASQDTPLCNCLWLLKTTGCIYQLQSLIQINELEQTGLPDRLLRQRVAVNTCFAAAR